MQCVSGCHISSLRHPKCNPKVTVCNPKCNPFYTLCNPKCNPWKNTPVNDSLYT